MFLNNSRDRAGGDYRASKNKGQVAAALVVLCSLTFTAQSAPLSLQQTLLNGVNGIDFIERPDGLAVTDELVHVVSDFGESLSTFQRDSVTGQLALLNAYHFEDDVTPLPAFEAMPNIVSIGANRAIMSAVVHDCYEDSCRGDLQLVTLEFDAAGSPNIISRSDNFTSTSQTLVTSPDNRHLYQLGRTIVAYNIGDDGFVQEVERMTEIDLNESRVSAIEDAHFTPDGRHIIAIGDSGGTPRTIATFERDTGNGRITLTHELVLPESLRIGTWLVLSPDGEHAYLLNPAEDDNDRNIARYAVNPASGEVTFVDYYDETNENFPNSLTRSDDAAISSNGRMLVVFDEGNQPGRIHLYTIDDNGALTHRGFEEAGRGGVTEDNLFVLDTNPAFSPDDAYVYMAGRFRDSVSVFAAHADMRVDIEQQSQVVEGTTAATQIALFNAGPATAHGINVEINASEPITSVFPAESCSLVSTVLAVCQIDELRAMVPQDIIVETVAPAVGEQVSISVEQTQYQVDLAPSDNRGNVSYVSIEEGVQEEVPEEEVPEEEVPEETQDTIPDDGTGAMLDDGEQESSSGGGGAIGLLLLHLLMVSRMLGRVRLS